MLSQEPRPSLLKHVRRHELIPPDARIEVAVAPLALRDGDRLTEPAKRPMPHDPDSSHQGGSQVRSKRRTRGRLAADQRGKWGDDTAHHDALHRFGATRGSDLARPSLRYRRALRRSLSRGQEKSEENASGIRGIFPRECRPKYLRTLERSDGVTRCESLPA